MENNFNLSKELQEILSEARKITADNKGKQVMLDTVLYCILKRYLGRGYGKGECESLRNYLLNQPRQGEMMYVVEHYHKSTMKRKSNKFPSSILPSFYNPDTIVMSENLEAAIKRSDLERKFLPESLRSNEITTDIFFISALFEEDCEMVEVLKNVFDLSRESYLGSLNIDLCNDINNVMKDLFGEDAPQLSSTGELKEKTITPPENSSTDPGEEDSAFESAGMSESISAKKADPNSSTPYLDEFAYDMTKAAKEGKYDSVVGRDREVGSLIEILACRKKNNAILLGEPGAGKTSVVEALVDKIANRQVPLELQNKRIVSLDLNALVAGSKYRGDYEARLQGVINEVLENKNVIVFIDECHNLIGNGSSSGQGDGANILKPYLARGEFQIIGATTKTEYRAIEKDGALKRRFQNVIVEEPDVKETEKILNVISTHYSNHHKVKYSPEVLKACSEWSARYIPDRHQPDKSIDIMDMSGALAKLSKIQDTKDIDEIQKDIEEATNNKIQATKEQDFEKASTYRDVEKILIKKLEDVKKELDTYNNDESNWPTVSIDNVAEVVSKLTNIPVDKIKSTDTAKIRDLRTSLLTNIVGQNETIEKVIKTLQLGILGIRDPKRPLCSFLFCGPSGTGKTLTAQLLAKYYYGSEKAIIRINMGEMDEHSKVTLLGSHRGTVGYDEPTPFDELATRPASVVLLDEVEKADPKIFDIILNAIGEEGYIALNNGKEISFRQSIVILTSNIGTKDLQNKGDGMGFNKATGEEKRKSDSSTVMKAIKKFFRPEFLNRLTGISVFNELNQDDMYRIFDLELAKINSRMSESGYIIEVTDKMKEFIVKSVDTKYGARDLTRKLMELVSNRVCEKMISYEDTELLGKNINVDLGENNEPEITFNAIISEIEKSMK